MIPVRPSKKIAPIKKPDWATTYGIPNIPAPTIVPIKVAAA